MIVSLAFRYTSSQEPSYNGTDQVRIENKTTNIELTLLPAIVYLEIPV